MDVPNYDTKIPEHIRKIHKEDLEKYQKTYDIVRKSLDGVLKFK